ncbi:MAG: ribosome-associated translation inhibitor RaiA [Candidatus Aminicenantes bacterium]|nr:ribosome-associated translation inhibitor RaiA [Candidatus Aminicenantes bacterium]
MNFHYTARHVTLSPDLKAYADKRLAGLVPFLDPSTEVDVILTAEKNRQRAEIQVRGKRGQVLIAEDGHDLAAAMNEAFDVLEKKLKKEREKFREKKRRVGREYRAAGPAEEPPDLPPRVVRVDYYTAKPLSIGDALVEFNLRKKEVLMFRSEEEEDRWAVLFRRKNGSYGLVRPE